MMNKRRRKFSFLLFKTKQKMLVSSWSLGKYGNWSWSMGYKIRQWRTSLVAQTIKNPPAMHKTWVRSLGWEDSLEEGMATNSSVLAWRIPWTEEPGGLQSMALQRVGHDWSGLASMHTEHWMGAPSSFFQGRIVIQNGNYSTKSTQSRIHFSCCLKS